jgi:hypothetical protein
MQLAERPRCGHCGLPIVGYGYALGEALCHPDQALLGHSGRADCYHLVTVYRHPMPCQKCKLQILSGEESP